MLVERCSAELKVEAALGDSSGELAVEPTTGYDVSPLVSQHITHVGDLP